LPFLAWFQQLQTSSQGDQLTNKQTAQDKMKKQLYVNVLSNSMYKKRMAWEYRRNHSSIHLAVEMSEIVVARPAFLENRCIIIVACGCVERENRADD
jgi:hypothetical protein